MGWYDDGMVEWEDSDAAAGKVIQTLHVNTSEKIWRVIIILGIIIRYPNYMGYILIFKEVTTSKEMEGMLMDYLNELCNFFISPGTNK